jgi:hypothetical protein
MAIDARGTGTGGGKAPGSKGSTRGVPNDIMSMGRVPRVLPKPDTVVSSGGNGGGNGSGNGGGNGGGSGSGKGKSIKIADSNLFVDQGQPSVDDMAVALFEQIGGHELIGIVSNDLVNPVYDLNGSNSAYQPIQNINKISADYSSENILKLQDTDVDYFTAFPISLDRFIPEYGSGTNGASVYTDSSGNLVLEFVNIRDNQRVQVEVLSYGNVISDTIY